MSVEKFQKFISDQPLILETGIALNQVEITYCTYGSLNPSRDNVIWINHALTANSDPKDWWNGFFGSGNIFDPDKYFIVCANMIGSCYGSTGPDSINPETGRRYGQSFPLITIRDMVRAHQLLRKHLNINSIYLSLGGSMGGQQTIEWAIMEPELIRHIALIATNAQHSPWGIAFNEAQRMALMADPTLNSDVPDAGFKGMAAARALAMISYRNYVTFQATQEDKEPLLENHLAATYQRYQGKKLSERFTPLSYLSLSKSMDTHHVGRGRGTTIDALSQVKAKTLVLGITTDILFPIQEQEFLAAHIPNASLIQIHSTYGHDGFLLEYETMGNAIKVFLE